MRFTSVKISFAAFLISALGLFVSGCTTGVELETPIKPWIEKEGTAHAVNISLEFENLIFKSAKEVHSYHASLKDGVLEGTFQVDNFDAKGKPVSNASGEITCMVFEDDCKTARIVGKITASSDSTYIGLFAVLTVIDDGVALKQTTDIRYPVDAATAKWHCDGGLKLEWYKLPSYIAIKENLKILSTNCK